MARKSESRDNSDLFCSPAFWIGSVLIVLAAVVLAIANGPSSELQAFAVSLLGSAGVALVLIAVVEVRSLRTALTRAADGIVSDTSDRLQKTVASTFEIIKQCEANGITAIHAPRQERVADSGLWEQIETAIRSSSTLRIIGISANDFFGRPGGSGTFCGPFWSSLKTRARDIKATSDSKFKIQVLLPNRATKVVKLRDSQVEKMEGGPGSIAKDQDRAIKGIDDLNMTAGREFISVRHYDHPHAWAVLSDEHVFIEQYHFAPTLEFCSLLAEQRLFASEPGVCCTGGRVPVIQFRKRSNMYCAFDVSFGFLWDLAPPAP